MVALGSDHGGFELKEMVKAYLDRKCRHMRMHLRG